MLLARLLRTQSVYPLVSTVPNPLTGAYLVKISSIKEHNYDKRYNLNSFYELQIVSAVPSTLINPK